ncbi:MAG: adenylyltransferase/cytidyltransferase family protein, partial [Planctomycetes bacterium]|nr:adenylyltransferase/cytidyltransferase family protein [Planctomycetota bacterium]
MDDEYQSKIVDGQGLADAVARVRADGRSIVLCHGCFDIVHPGHIRYLEFARKHGDLLIVS